MSSRYEEYENVIGRAVSFGTVERAMELERNGVPYPVSGDRRLLGK